MSNLTPDELFRCYVPLHKQGILSDLTFTENGVGFLTVTNIAEQAEINISHAQAVVLRDWLTQVLA